MEKLSERFMYYCGLLAAYKVTKNIDINAEDLKHIQDLIDAEEQGLLFSPPCKIGDIVWSLDNYCNECYDYDDYCHRDCKNPKYRLQKHIVRRLEVTENEIYICSFDRHEMYGKLGETIFLTKEEAEQELAKMKEV